MASADELEQRAGTLLPVDDPAADEPVGSCAELGDVEREWDAPSLCPCSSDALVP
jgi:hypothetical protein